MAEIAYLMGKDSKKDANQFFTGANAYFKAAFAGDPANKIVTPKPLTLDGVLAHLAKETTTYSVVHIVTHAGDQGLVMFGLAELIGYNDVIDEATLNRALDEWAVNGDPALRPLWARAGPSGGAPVSVDQNTIIQIDGCSIGMCPNFISAFGEMFATKGTIRASTRLMLFAVEAKASTTHHPPVMGQARERAIAGGTLPQKVPVPPKSGNKAAIEKAATDRATFNSDFAQRYFDRILVAPEAAHHLDALNDCDFVAELTKIASSASAGFERPIRPWLHIFVDMPTRDFARKVEPEEALDLLQQAYWDDAVSVTPLPLFDAEAVDADDCNFPLRLWEFTPRFALSELKDMDDPDHPGSLVTGTRIDGEMVQVRLVEPILNSDATWLAQVDPTSPSQYATVTFTAREPQSPTPP